MSTTPAVNPLEIAETSTQLPVSGDLAIAYRAQLNRHLGANKLALVPDPITPGESVLGVALLLARYSQAAATLPEDGTAALRKFSAAVGTTGASQHAYVTQNLRLVTQQLALWGNLTGIAPATVGITDRRGYQAKTPWGWIAAGVGVALLGVGYLVARRSGGPSLQGALAAADSRLV